jgi:periplasmic protein TonB
MAYLDQQDPRKKLAGASMVVLVHVGLAFGLAAGLTITYTAPPVEPPLQGTTVLVHVPPPEPDAPEPTATTTPRDVTIFVPQPPVTFAETGSVETTFDPPSDDLVDRIITPTNGGGVVRPPDPVPSFTPRIPRPANGPAGWVTTADYPGRALSRGWEGEVGYALDISANGRVDQCRVVSSSGHDVLDTTACRKIQDRARFDPATDHNGARVAGSWRGTVSWTIPED